ncbi:hypothetical protein HPB47_024544 [Ixodes persulcatus]|uniref:Uncharacterized protein n=1 Tax=Ixodes persulcatus TaxID=34615 RepID=A0AC60Q3Z6_IXOPE|nr:hypothetical protein HPB47_024544 [Ixodes persulcatus]
MGGVDKSDQNLSYYPAVRDGQKVYYKIFRHLFDMCVYDSFVLYKKQGGALNQLDYRLDLVEKDGHKADLALAMQVEKRAQLKRRVSSDDESTTTHTNGYSSAGSKVQLRKPALTTTRVNLDSERLPHPDSKESVQRWKRILLLVVAVTVHNIPEGLAVRRWLRRGWELRALDVRERQVRTSIATVSESGDRSLRGRPRNLALGIGIQNFPEGLAVSLPLRGAGFSRWKAFWYGQLSGVVEPLAGVLGCLAVTMAQPILPYALAFAAGAMVYVVVDDIVPEAQACSNGRLASWTTILGFVVMMALDVGLG